MTLLVFVLIIIFFGLTVYNEAIIETLAEDSSLSAVEFYIAQIPEIPTEDEATYEEYFPYFYIPAPPMPEPPTPPPPPYKIAITFDDGPSRYTGYILDILEEHNARATFFVLGNRIHSRADIIIRAAELGNEIAGHSWNHRDFSRLVADAIRQQIKDTNAAIEYVLGEPPPPFFRPPYGVVTSRVRRVAEEFGYAIVNWSIDPRDWQNRDADIIYYHVMNHAVDGAIVLLHDIRPYTAEAVQRIVPSLMERGFELVTVSELLEYFFGDLVPGDVYTGFVRPRE